MNQQNTTFDLKRNRWVQLADRCLPGISCNLSAETNLQRFADILRKQSQNPIVLVIGGSVLGIGMGKLASTLEFQLVETDVSFGPRTQLICDAHELPFADQSFDGVVVQAVLQYVVDPALCACEIERVLKPKGLIYAETAFMQQVVHGPYDYTRFTHQGIRRLFHRFEELDSGIAGGPGMALAWSIQFFLLSFTASRWLRRMIHFFSRLTLFWLKFFDAGLKHNPGAYHSASGFHFLGQKTGLLKSDRDRIAGYRGIS